MGSASSAAPWYCSGRRAAPKEGSDELRIGFYRPRRPPQPAGRRDGGECKAEGRFRPGAYCPVREERTRPDNAAVAPYRWSVYESGAPERDISRILSSPARAVEVMIISLGPRLPEASSDLTRGHWAGHPSLRRTGERPPIWSCSGWGLPCPLGRPRGGGLLPRLFTLTPGELKSRGGVFSVALSVSSRSLRVTEHPALRSSDFPLRRSRSDHPSHSGVRGIINARP